MAPALRRLLSAAALLAAALAPALAAADEPPVRFGWDPSAPPLHLPVEARGVPLPGWSLTPKLLLGRPLGRGQGTTGGGLAFGGRLPFQHRAFVLEVELQGGSGSSQQVVSVTQGAGTPAGTLLTRLDRKQGAVLLTLQRRFEDLLANYFSLIAGAGAGVIASSNTLVEEGVTTTSTELRPAGHLSLALEYANLGPGSLQLETRLQVRGDAPLSPLGGVSAEWALLAGYRLWLR